MADFYYSELQAIYEEGEIQSMFELAVSHYVGIPFSEVRMRQNEHLNQSELIKIYDCCKSLKKQVPLQYILGESFFYGLRLMVNRHVLIPRPETEELVDWVVKENPDAVSFLDIGTGSGCIPIALKSRFKTASVYACDISTEALAVAKHNALKNNLPVVFFETDILNPVSNIPVAESGCDVIISNPPYIKTEEKKQLQANVLEYEPHLALFVNDEDDIIFYKRIIDLCGLTLKPGGKLYFELNPITAHRVLLYAQQSGLFASSHTFNDLSGNQRFMKAIKANR